MRKNLWLSLTILLVLFSTKAIEAQETEFVWFEQAGIRIMLPEAWAQDIEIADWGEIGGPAGDTPNLRRFTITNYPVPSPDADLYHDYIAAISVFNCESYRQDNDVMWDVFCRHLIDMAPDEPQPDGFVVHESFFHPERIDEGVVFPFGDGLGRRALNTSGRLWLYQEMPANFYYVYNGITDDETHAIWIRFPIELDVELPSYNRDLFGTSDQSRLLDLLYVWYENLWRQTIYDMPPEAIHPPLEFLDTIAASISIIETIDIELEWGQCHPVTPDACPPY